MSGRSPSGVASLRARFEQKKGSTSPPSRGRSPAGSTTSDNSRPLSKVRTSFVSVEGSGRMGDQLNPKVTETSDAVASSNLEVSKAGTNGDIPSQQDINCSLTHESKGGASSLKANVRSEPRADDFSVANTKPADVDGNSDANPDKPVSTVEDNSAGMLPADPKDEEAVSGGAALGKNTVGLGSILKGSPFEQDKGSQVGAPKPSKAKAGAPHLSPTKSKPEPSINGHTRGKPKEVPASKLTTQSKPKAVNPTTSAQQKEAVGKTPSSSSVPPKSQPKAVAPPPTVETASNDRPVFPTSDGTAEKEPLENSSNEPQTPSDATVTTSTSRATLKKTPPKPVKSKEPSKEAARDIKKPTARPSAVSKPPPAAGTKSHSASSTSNAKPVKTSNPTSPKLGLNKPRPRSPPRPTRLPAAATAPTAASAAKLDGAPPSTHDRKPINFQSIRDRVPSNSTKAQPKTPRTSLPASSKPIEKPKAAKPRQSMAGSKAPEGSFLDRMMRPTQSSSQKTHDRVEPKTPPKKQQQQHVPKPKRTSEGSDKSKTDSPEAKTEVAREPASSTKQTTGEPKDVLSSSTTSGARFYASAAAHTVPPTIPVP